MMTQDQVAKHRETLMENGKWWPCSMMVKTTTTVGGMSVSADYVGVGSDFTYMLELTDPDQLKTSGGYKVTLTTTTNGQSSTQVQQVPNTTLNGKWVRNEMILKRPLTVRKLLVL